VEELTAKKGYKGFFQDSDAIVAAFERTEARFQKPVLAATTPTAAMAREKEKEKSRLHGVVCVRVCVRVCVQRRHVCCCACCRRRRL
jgi:hypothetical protein